VIKDIERLRSGTIKSRLAFLLRDSAFYGGLDAFATMANIFLVPIYTRMFSKSEFGSYDALSVISGVIVPFLLMGLDSAVARYFYETEDISERRALVTQSLAFQFALSVLIAVVLTLFADEVVGWVFSQPTFTPSFRIITLSLPFITLCRITRGLLKWTFQRRRFMVMTLVSVLVQFCCILGYLLLVERSIIGIFYGQLISTMVFAGLGCWYCRNFLGRIRGWGYLTRLLTFGYPYMLIAVAGALIPAIDRLFMVNIVTLEVMALYALGKKLTSLMNLPFHGFQVAWGPFVFSLYKETNATETYDRVLRLFTMLMLTISFALVIFADPLICVFGTSQYLESRFVIIPLSMAIVVDGISWITGVGVDLSKKSYLSSLNYLLGLSITVLAVWLLVKPAGMVGVASGVLLGRCVQTCLKTYFAYKVWPNRYSLDKVVGVTFGTLMLEVMYQLVPAAGFMQFVLRAGGAMLFYGLLVWTVSLNTRERALVSGLLRRKLQLWLARKTR